MCPKLYHNYLETAETCETQSKMASSDGAVGKITLEHVTRVAPCPPIRTASQTHLPASQWLSATPGHDLWIYEWTSPQTLWMSTGDAVRGGTKNRSDVIHLLTRTCRLVCDKTTPLAKSKVEHGSGLHGKRRFTRLTSLPNFSLRTCSGCMTADLVIIVWSGDQSKLAVFRTSTAVHRCANQGLKQLGLRHIPGEGSRNLCMMQEPHWSGFVIWFFFGGYKLCEKLCLTGRPNQGLTARPQYLQCVSNGDTACSLALSHRFHCRSFFNRSLTSPLWQSW